MSSWYTCSPLKGREAYFIDQSEHNALPTSYFLLITSSTIGMLRVYPSEFFQREITLHRDWKTGMEEVRKETKRMWEAGKKGI